MTPGAAPTIPGVSKTDAPNGGADLMQMLAGKMSGQAPGPRLSAGDKVAQAVQLLREAAQMDLRIAPLLQNAIQLLVTGGGPGGGPGQPPPSPVQGPAAQSQNGSPGAMSAIASMMGGGPPRG